jgi:hypothetical protein
MSERTITLHTFCSVKGGVGKSTLAVVCAKLLAADKRVPALVDCDLTGTSLADGLRLQAPRVALLSDGAVDLRSAPTGEPPLSIDETRRLRARRRDAAWQGRVHPPPYFNDVLNAVLDRQEPVRVDAALWRHEREDGVAYLPSSSIHHDIAGSLRWYNERDPFEWAECFLWALDDLAQQRPTLTDVVIDLPPGTWGFPHETMVIVSTLQRQAPLPQGYPVWHEGPTRWAANPFLVTSADGNDLLPALEYVGRHQREQLPTLKPLVNRATEGLDVVRGRARDLLGPAFAAMGLEQKVERVPEVAALARIFKEGDVPLSREVLALRQAFRIEKKT